MTDRVFASVWTPDLSEMLAPIPNRKGITWLDPLNGPGSGSLQVPADDPAAAYLKDRNLVRFHYAGDYRYAFRIQNPSNVVVGDRASDRWLSVAGPGVMSMLNDAVLYPEYGLSRASLDERAFSFASAISDWYVSSEWVAPEGVGWTVDTSSRAGDPSGWPDHSAQWIWDTDPDGDSPDFKVVYFRSTFTLTANTIVVINATADNFYELYLNGEQILFSGYDDPWTWQRLGEYSVALPAGTYLLAARVMNAFRGIGNLDINPAGFICSVAVSVNGKPGTVLRRTDTTHWLCRPEGTTPPAWRAAQVLHAFISEAQFRGVDAVAALTEDFTPAVDSNGDPWTDSVDRTFTVGTKGLDMVEQLTELSIDVAVGADLVVHAWTQRGTDKSVGGNPVVLRPALNLKGYRVATDLAITTRLLVRTPNGWVEAAASNEGADGRVEDMLQLGNASSDVQATRQAHAAFGDVAHPVITFEATCLPVPGATPYVDFDNGDFVLAPDGAGSAARLRVMSISVSEDEKGAVTFVPELYEA